MESHSFSVFKHHGENIMNPNEHAYKWLANKLGRWPTLEEFPDFQQHKYRIWNEQQLIRTLAKQGLTFSQDLYVRINHGSRAGSIAKAINLDVMFIYDRQYQNIHHSNRVTLEFDCGKQFEIKGTSFFEKLEDNECADLLVGYTGKTVNKFTKKPRVEEPPAEIFDAHGCQLNIGDWVMNNKFRPGKIIRISAKGSMWINYLALGIDRYWAKQAAINVREGIPNDFLKIKTPEEMDTMAQIMDYDLTSFKLDYNVEFGAKDD